MMAKRIIEFIVGLFILAGIVALLLLAFKASSVSQYSTRDSYHIDATFDNVGDLKVRAPITIGGVRVGEVDSISLDSKNFKAKVGMRIDKRQNSLPSDTTAKILTAGLIGANYIELIPGYEESNLQDGSVIVDTQPAIILENLVGQLIYQLKGDNKKEIKNSK